MDLVDSHAGALFAGVVLDVAILWIALDIRATWRADRRRCLCGHERRRHVSWRDWDSDYGDPQHRGPDYKKPGTCRECLCRHYMPGRQAA